MSDLCSICLFVRNGDLHKFLFNIAEYGNISGENQEARTGAQSYSTSTNPSRSRQDMPRHQPASRSLCRETEDEEPDSTPYSRSSTATRGRQRRGAKTEHLEKTCPTSQARPSRRTILLDVDEGSSRSTSARSLVRACRGPASRDYEAEPVDQQS